MADAVKPSSVDVVDLLLFGRLVMARIAEVRKKKALRRDTPIGEQR